MESKPTVLVYGAGVLGCSIAHQLITSGHADVSLLARGAWADSLERNGLTIEHVVQRRTTRDRVRVVRSLEPTDAYDLVIVAMQAQQSPEALAKLAASRCREIVFVGNNVDASELEHQLHALSTDPKECAFGFYSVGGRREGDHVIAAHVKLSLTVGAASGELSGGFKEILALSGLAFSLQDEMDGWLKWHAASILPLAFLSYANGCDLTRTSQKDLTRYIDACAELGSLFRQKGIPIRPEGDDAFFRGGPKRAYLRVFYTVVFKTALGRLCITDHCLHAVCEMRSLESALEKLLGLDKRPDAAPTYQTLKAAMPAWEALAADPCCATKGQA